MRRFVLALAIAVALALSVRAPEAQQVTIGLRPGSLKLAVLGDNGTGERPQYDVADRMWAAYGAFPFELVLLLGDNMYGRQDAKDFVDALIEV